MADLKFSVAQSTRPVDYVPDGSEAFGCSANASSATPLPDGTGMSLQEIANFAAGGVRNSIYAASKSVDSAVHVEEIPSGAREVDITGDSTQDVTVLFATTFQAASELTVGNGDYVVTAGSTPTLAVGDTANYFSYVAPLDGATIYTQWR